LPGAITGGLAQPPSAQFTPGDIIRILRSNLPIMLGLLIVAGVAGYFINDYLSKYYSKFTTTGMIQIQPLINNSPLVDKRDQEVDVGPMATDIRTQVQLLRQEALVTRTLSNASRTQIRNTKMFKRLPADNSVSLAKQEIAASLAVNAVPETRLINISLTGPYKDDVAVIVEEIVQQHLDEQSEMIHLRQKDRSRMLGELRTNYRVNFERVSEEIRQMQIRLGGDVSSFGNTSAFGSNPSAIELGQLSVGRTSVQLNATRAESAYKKAVEELTRGQDPAQVVARVENDPEVKSAREELQQIELALADNAEQFGENHPIVKSLSKRAILLSTRLDQIRGDLLAKSRASYIEELKVQADDTQAYLVGIDARTAELKGELAEFANAAAKYYTLKDEQAGYKELLDRINKQLDDINAMNNRELRTVAWVTKPQLPDEPSFPKLTSTMGMSLAMALALGLGIAFLRELMDTTVRSPRDITRVGQLSLLGMIPHEDDDPQSAGARLPLVIFDAPHSIMAEQFRHIRTRLQHAASLDTTRTIMVTAPTPKDGKTTVACNLAAGLALNGRKILLVDADFRRPELHRVFGFSNEVGFSNVLSGQSQFKDSVRDSQIPNLSVMTSGPKPPNATELFESQLYNDFIERAAEEFDHVIFDSGPFLVVSESFAMAPRVDGVVTVVRAHKDSRGILTRMRDTLRQVKAEHLGVILNAVRAHGGGYYGRNIKTYYAYERGSE